MKNTLNKILGDNPLQLLRDYAQMSLGLSLYAIGYTTFLLPYQIVSGGVSGISTLIYYVTGFHASYTYLFINTFLLVLAAKIMGWRYFVRTIFGTLVISFIIGLLQGWLTTIDASGNEVITRVIGEQKFMACVIGGLMEGLGLAIVFLAGGSTGGTDIIASSINKYWDISLGRLLIGFDILIIGSSYFISHSVETVVVGYVTMVVSLTFLDFVINGARQSVQFTIISEKHEEIANAVSNKVDRGVTVLYGEGWYSKEQRRVLLIMARKYESRQIFRLIHEIDTKAFVTMTNVEGVFGEGFDKIKK